MRKCCSPRLSSRVANDAVWYNTVPRRSRHAGCRLACRTVRCRQASHVPTLVAPHSPTALACGTAPLAACTQGHTGSPGSSDYGHRCTKEATTRCDSPRCSTEPDRASSGPQSPSTVMRSALPGPFHRKRRYIGVCHANSQPWYRPPVAAVRTSVTSSFPSQRTGCPARPPAQATRGQSGPTTTAHGIGLP